MNQWNYSFQLHGADIVIFDLMSGGLFAFEERMIIFVNFVHLYEIF